MNQRCPQWRYYLFSLLLSLAMGSPTYAEVISIKAVSDSWPPYTDPEHPQGGILVELVETAFARVGLEVEIEYVPWVRALKGTENAEYDILIDAWWTPERARVFHYSYPMLASGIRFIKRSSDEFDYQGIDSLHGKKLGTIRGYGYGSSIVQSEHFQREEATDLITNLRKLAYGRIDLTLEDEAVAAYTLRRQTPELRPLLSFTGPPLSVNSLYVISSLQNPRHKELIALFNQGLSKMHADGSYHSLLQRYQLGHTAIDHLQQEQDER